MVGARSRCLDVTHANATGPVRQNAGGQRFDSGVFYGAYRDCLSRPNYKFSRDHSHRSRRRHLHLCLHPAEARTTTNTLVGAIPGALPPLIGWAAARDSLNFGAWTLFAIVFIWQIPHFFAIAWLCRRDYAQAGFRMLSSDGEPGFRTASQAVLLCL